MDREAQLPVEEGIPPAGVHAAHRAPPRKPITPLLALLLLVNLAASLYQLPLNRLVERRLCREYYSQHEPSAINPGGSIPEELCKLDGIQQGLGWIQGIMETTWIVGDFVMTIPLGFVAEKYGRRAVLWLNLIPRIFMVSWAVFVGYFESTLPTRVILLGPSLSFLGGDCVFNSVTYSLAATLTDDYVVRASYFGYMSSVSYVVALLGPALASATMSWLLWLPFWLGIALLLCAIPTISLLPDHPGTSIAPHDDDYESQSRPLLSSPLLKAQDSDKSWFRSVVDRFDILRSILTSHPRNFTLMLIAFFLTSLASSDTKLLVQYISKRYHWTFASAGYLISGKAVVNFFLLTIVIPKLLRSRAESSTLSTDKANVRYANICLAISVAGALAIAVAATVWLLVPSLFVYALGSALPIFTLSLLKSPFICPPNDSHAAHKDEPETHIFSIVMLTKTLGSLLGAPLMATLWVKGIGMGGAGLGLPYFVSAASYVAAIVVFRGIRVG